MSSGNPEWIAVGWGEATKAFKLPVRIGEMIRDMKEDGMDADGILELLEGESKQSSDDVPLDEIVELLQEALTLKPNAGGAIKKLIRQALELLGEDSEST